MDYLCELPNDSSRRKALQNLPPTLPATYERILRSVNTRPKETRLLVSRTLRWIVHCNPTYMTTEALCEAVSINIGDTKRDKESIPDELEVLRWCSSLVRKNADPVSHDTIELAHFTVKEFLLQLDDDDMGEFADYRIGPNHDEIDLAKICLTYLNFCDFDQEVRIDKELTERRLEDYPLRRYAICNWYGLARPRLADHEALSLAKQLFNSSKAVTLLSWLHDWIILRIVYPVQLDIMNKAIAGASVLHFASMLALPELCRSLIDSVGCDLNRNSAFGTPLHCSLLGMESLTYLEQHWNESWLSSLQTFRESWLSSLQALWKYEEQDRVIEVLLGAGADPNRDHMGVPPLLLSLHLWDFPSATLLIDNGARLDEHCLGQLERVLEDVVQEGGTPDEDFQRIISHVQSQTVEAKDPSQLLKMTMKFRSSWEDFERANFESDLRAAAEFGQIDVIDQMLGKQPTTIEAAEERTGLAALHYAAMNDHLDVVKLLFKKGADPFKADFHGKTAVHYATSSNGILCLEYFLGKGFADVVADDQGLVLWHLAALAQTKQKLESLTKYSTPMPQLSNMRTKDGWSPLLSAASIGSADNIEWLLCAGCTATELAQDGSTALHLAARCGSLKAVQALLAIGSDANAVTKDGSNVLHFALIDLNKEVGGILDALFERGANASNAREDGTMAIDILITHYNSMIPTYGNFDHEALLAAFRAFLAGNNDLTRRNRGGYSTLQLIADSWLKSTLRPDWLNNTTACETANEIILMAIARIPLAKSSHDPFTDPKFTISALMIRNEGLVNAFLRYSPDVDALSGDWSIIKAACLHGCSLTLLQDLLSRSIFQHKKEQLNSVLRELCRADPENSRHGVVEILLNAGLSPNNQPSAREETPLMIAAYNGNTEIMKELLSYGADVHALDRGGINVAHHACFGGYIEAVNILQTTTVDFDRRGSISIQSETFNGAHILHIAAADESSTLLQFLLDENLITDINVTCEQSETALSIAAWLSRPLNVSILLSKKANAEIRSHGTSETPLHIATRVGNDAVVRIFLQHDCDINVLDGGGLDCETLAKRHGHSGIEKLLREYREERGRKRTASPQNNFQPLRASRMLKAAIDLGDLEFCQRLVDEQTNKNAPSSFGHSRPSISAGDLLELRLADSKSNDSPEDAPLPSSLKTATPLIIAAYSGHTEVARLLLKYGASPHTTDIIHQTALYFAAKKSRPELVELLLDHGANVHVVNHALETPSMIAAEYGSWASLQVLKARGADFGSRDCGGWTAIHRASSSNSMPFVQFLAMVGDENLGQEDNRGMSPLSCALCWGSWHKILSLINYAPSLGAYSPRLGNILSSAIVNPEMTPSLLKKLLRRLSPPIVADLLRHRDTSDGTPLYAACTTAPLPFQQDKIDLLLEAGADIEHVGGEHGTPLMGACAAGRLTVVKFLIDKGAKLCYDGDDGTIISALHAAKHFPEIKR
ncbi:MAG: hypothetical protein Q9221_002996 [Calogaya cf. arnoldii]